MRSTAARSLAPVLWHFRDDSDGQIEKQVCCRIPASLQHEFRFEDALSESAATPVNGFTITGVSTGNEDGFGLFNTSFTFFDGYSNAVSSITLNITAATGTNWQTDADVLKANANGYSAAAHIFVANPGYTNTNSSGFATNSGRDASPVPARAGRPSER